MSVNILNQFSKLQRTKTELIDYSDLQNIKKKERKREPRKLEQHSHGEQVMTPSLILIHPIQRTLSLSQNPLQKNLSINFTLKS
jgi:hypothetical protein